MSIKLPEFEIYFISEGTFLKNLNLCSRNNIYTSFSHSKVAPYDGIIICFKNKFYDVSPIYANNTPLPYNHVCGVVLTDQNCKILVLRATNNNIYLLRFINGSLSEFDIEYSSR
jgi:hypothetical protein